MTYESAAAELAAALRLGYEEEQADPNFDFEVPPDAEIAWISAWLASEGFARPTVRVLSDAINNMVVHALGRRHPGLVVQGDRLRSWRDLASVGDPRSMEVLAVELDRALSWYAQVSHANGLESS